MRQRNYFKTFFVFKEVSHEVSKYFGRPLLGRTIKTNFVKF